MITDKNGLIHSAGCTWFCGVHDPEVYRCTCETPRPRRGRGNRTCRECLGRIEQPDNEQ